MKGKKRAARRPQKRPYRAPKLRTYGDLKALTTMKGGNRMDGGGNPKTRTAGGV